jgi:hypothetical protein
MELPVFSIVREAYAFVWRERSLFWSLALPGIIVLSLFGAVSQWLIWVEAGRPANFALYMANTMENGLSTAFVISMVVGVFLYWAVLTLYSVAWHRAYFGVAARPTAASTYRWRGRQTQFFFNYVKIGLLLIPVMLVVSVVVGLVMGIVAIPFAAGGFSTAAVLIITVGSQIVVWGVVGWLFARFSLLFPATAVDEHMKFRAGWRFTRGNGWRILWIMVVAALPFWVVMVPVSFVFKIIMMQSGLSESLTATLVNTLLWQIVAFAIAAIGVSALSISYARLRVHGSLATTPP